MAAIIKLADLEKIHDKLRDTCDIELCRSCDHWTEYRHMPGDNPEEAGECNNFSKPRECVAVKEYCFAKTESSDFDQLVFIG